LQIPPNHSFVTTVSWTTVWGPPLYAFTAVRRWIPAWGRNWLWHEGRLVNMASRA